MDVTPNVPKGKLLISRYGNGRFVVGETSHAGGILLASQVWPWAISEIRDITELSLAPILSLAPLPEVLLIGMGERFAPVPDPLRTALRRKGIVTEGMDTGAACRTYNVLATEDRRVAAALIAI